MAEWVSFADPCVEAKIFERSIDELNTHMTMMRTPIGLDECRKLGVQQAKLVKEEIGNARCAAADGPQLPHRLAAAVSTASYTEIASPPGTAVTATADNIRSLLLLRLLRCVCHTQSH